MQRKKEIIESYIVEGYEVVPTPFFLYEITVCKITKNSFETLSMKQYKSESKLNFTHEEYKKIGDVTYAKIIDMLGAPIDYINDYVTNNNKSRRVRKGRSDRNV